MADKYHFDFIVLVTEQTMQDNISINELLLSFYNLHQSLFTQEFETRIQSHSNAHIKSLAFITFKQLIKAIDETLYSHLVSHSFSFILATYGKDLFFRTIPMHAAKEHFHPQFIDLKNELFIKMTRTYPHIYSQLNKDFANLLLLMCRQINLQEDKAISSPLQRRHQLYKTLLHYLCVQSHNPLNEPTIISPESIYAQQQPSYNNHPSFSLSMDPDQIEDQQSQNFFRLRRIPNRSREKDIQSFFSWPIKIEAVALIFEKGGLFTGEAIVQVNGKKTDLQDQAQHHKRMGEHNIEILDSSSQEFQAALGTQICLKYQKYSPPKEINSSPTQFIKKSGIIRIRGLPYRVTPLELSSFFSDFVEQPKRVPPLRRKRQIKQFRVQEIREKCTLEKTSKKSKQRKGEYQT